MKVRYGLLFCFCLGVVGCSSLQQLASYGCPDGHLPNGKQVGLPKATSRVFPRYPREALEEKIRGFVFLRYDILPSGQVTNLRIEESCPEAVFSRAAIRAVKQWAFEPSQEGYKGAYQIIRFKLESRKPR